MIQTRITGPFHFRFIIQPLIAIILGIRDGRRDAILGRQPYVLNILMDKGNRKKNLRNGLKSIAKPLIVGIFLDAIIQVYLFNSLKLLGAVIVGIVAIGLPYALARGLLNRFARWSIKFKQK